MGNHTEKINELTDILNEQFEGLLNGAQEDINQWVSQISQQMIVVSAMGREDLQEELLGQLKALAGRQRIRATDAAWATVGAVASTVMKLLATI